jgi:hypothetical protein
LPEKGLRIAAPISQTLLRLGTGQGAPSGFFPFITK